MLTDWITLKNSHFSLSRTSNKYHNFWVMTSQTDSTTFCSIRINTEQLTISTIFNISINSSRKIFVGWNNLMTTFNGSSPIISNPILISILSHWGMWKPKYLKLILKYKRILLDRFRFILILWDAKSNEFNFLKKIHTIKIKFKYLLIQFEKKIKLQDLMIVWLETLTITWE